MGSTDNQTYFIIDTYSRFSRDKICFTFCINGREFCVKEVKINSEGEPILSSIEEESMHYYFHLHESEEEARAYVRKLKKLEGIR